MDYVTKRTLPSSRHGELHAACRKPGRLRRAAAGRCETVTPSPQAKHAAKRDWRHVAGEPASRYTPGYRHAQAPTTGADRSSCSRFHMPTPARV